MTAAATLSLRIRDTLFAVIVSNDGKFRVDQTSGPGKRLGYVGPFDTLEQLRQELMTETKKATLKVSIQATRLNQTTATVFTVVGQNQHSNKLIVRVDGRREEWDHWSTLYRPLTTAETEEFEQLANAVQEASRKLAAFKAGKELDVRGMLRAEEARLDKIAEAEANANEAVADARAAGETETE